MFCVCSAKMVSSASPKLSVLLYGVRLPAPSYEPVLPQDKESQDVTLPLPFSRWKQSFVVCLKAGESGGGGMVQNFQRAMRTIKNERTAIIV